MNAELILPDERPEKSGRSVMPVPADAGALVAIIARAASDPHVDIDKMERLLAMHERLQDNARAEEARQRREISETAFNAAMVAAQSEMRPIAEDAMNPQTRSKYASYAAIDKHLRPIYTRHGFAMMFGETESPKPEHVRVVCDVIHSAGFTKTYYTDMPADGKGAKGGDVMTKTHATGSAKSYGKRYLVRDIWNVAVGEDDDDGNGEDGCINKEQVATLDALLKEGGADMAKALRFMKVKSLAEIPAKNFEPVLKDIQAVNAAKARARAAK
jgi:hypothetical protein